MAGLLGQIFSAGNVAKRQLRDLLGNPVLSAQQMAGNLNDRARNLNEMTSAAAREGMDYGPATQRLAGLMAEGYNPMGLTVFHGSPAKFNRFDRTKIGSGEGAQAYGYGHYVAESPAVARGYQEKLSSTGGAKRIASQFPKIDDAIGEAQRKVTHYENLIASGGNNVPLDRANHFLQMSKKNLQDLQDMKSGLPENKGAFYEIDLPDDQIARMLDFDKPLIEQSKEIQSLAKQYGLTDADHMGGDLIAAMGAKRAAGAEAMRQAGVPGIRYFDQDSRGAEQGTQNFVVFPGNEDLLTILKRNGGLLD